MSEKNATCALEHRENDSTTDTESYSLKANENNPQAWLTVLGSFLIYYSSYGLINSFGFFQDYYQRTSLGSSSQSTIAFVGTMQIALMNCLAPVSGALCDSFGIWYLYICAGLGTFVSLMALSLCTLDSVWKIFLIQGILMGTSIGFAVQPALAVVGQQFKHRRVRAMGTVTAGCGLGGVCFPIMFTRLLRPLGFSWTLRVAAFKIGFCYILAICISTSRRTKRPVKDVCTSLLDYRGFRDPRYSTLCLGIFIVQFGIWVPIYYIEPYCSAINPNASLKGYFLPLINGCSIFGMVLGGVLGDIIGPLNLLCPTGFLVGLLSLILWLPYTTLTPLILFACLFGFFSGMFIALNSPVIARISPKEKLGARIGAFFSVIAIASLVGTPIGGALLPKGDDLAREAYRGVILYSGGTILFGALVLFGSRILHDRNLRARW
ncbi:MFS general substrate transporter [Lophiostoma macrostomum CBS 122681]|uniref:MFS general substrate transporter n=1 Tax=Lophiostoma macrostomum CBS 122681 TaxID=1314788 RepID=A0A6A6TAP8_9PLEO|nr:MFS general substrate transporter [Lophiostoma macrostomum CBS 122681]